MNKYIGLGRLGKDPVSKATRGGTETSTFSIAIDEPRKVDGEWVNETQWVNCVAFGKIAESANKRLEKGSQVLIEGKLNTSSWEKDGKKNYKTEVIVTWLKPLTKKEQKELEQAKLEERYDQDIEDDDIPF